MIKAGQLYNSYSRTNTGYIVALSIVGKQHGQQLVSGDPVASYEYTIFRGETYVCSGRESLEHKRGRHIVNKVSYSDRGSSLGPKQTIKRILKRQIIPELEQLLSLPAGATLEFYPVEVKKQPVENSLNFNKFRVMARIPLEQ